MIVSFISVDSDGNKMAYQSFAIEKDNEIIFEDKSSIQTQIKLSFIENGIKLLRFGFVNMEMNFISNTFTEGYYKNNEGVNFEFKIYTNKLFIAQKKISGKYELWLDKDKISTHDFFIRFLE